MSVATHEYRYKMAGGDWSDWRPYFEVLAMPKMNEPGDAFEIRPAQSRWVLEIENDDRINPPR